MSSLHKKYSAEAFDERLKMLTLAFVKSKPWGKPDEEVERQFDTWIHGACTVLGIEEPMLLKIPDHMPEDGPSFGGYDWVPASDSELGFGYGTISVRRWSIISLLHNFRHHMYQMTLNEHLDDASFEAEDPEDAQAWACSLFFTVAPRRFTRMVNQNRIAGVHPEDMSGEEAEADA